MSHADDLTELYNAIGIVVCTWAFAEVSLDSAIAAIVTLPGGKKVIPILPITLKHKITALQDAFKKVPILKPMRLQALRAIATVQNVKQDRHELIHSVLTSPKAKNRVYRYHSMTVENGYYHGRYWNFDLKKFPALQRRLDAAARDSIWLASALVAIATTKP